VTVDSTQVPLLVNGYISEKIIEGKTGVDCSIESNMGMGSDAAHQTIMIRRAKN
jgi:hypothetical protein